MIVLCSYHTCQVVDGKRHRLDVNFLGHPGDLQYASVQTLGAPLRSNVAKLGVGALEMPSLLEIHREVIIERVMIVDLLHYTFLGIGLLGHIALCKKLVIRVQSGETC